MKRKRRFQNPWGKGGEHYNQSAVGGSQQNVESSTSLVSGTGENFYPGQTSTETPNSTTDSINSGRLLQHEEDETEAYNPWLEDGEYYPDNVLDSKDPNDPKSVLYTTAVVRQNQTNVEEGGFYYSKDGRFLGEIKGKKQAVRVVTEQYIAWKGGISETATNITQIQKGINSGYEPSIKHLSNLNTDWSKEIYDDNKKFLTIANIIRYEGLSNNYQEYLWIAHTINNEVLEREKTTVYDLLMTGYSRSSEKYPMRFFDDRSKYAVAAVIDVYNGGTDPTNGATLWDGTDFLAWGLKSTNGTPHNKFEEYKSIFIKKDVYDKYLENTLKKYSTGKARYKVKGNNVYHDIPADVFKNQENWSSGNFLYNTGVNITYGIESVDTKGYTIFWKKVK